MSQKEGLGPEAPGAGDEIGRVLGIELKHLDALEVRDLGSRLRVADAEGVARIIGVGSKKGQELLRRFMEAGAGGAERSILRTPDARRLGRELLSLFAEMASGELGRQGFRATSPTVSPDLIHSRLSLEARARELLAGLNREKKLEEVRELLKGAFFEKAKSGESGVFEYFSARRRFVATASTLLEKYGEVPEISELMGPVSNAKIALLSRTMSEASGGPLEDAEAAVSDAEAVINDELRRDGIDAESAREVVEAHVEEIVSSLGMNAAEEEELRRSALEGLRIPFEFERRSLRDVLRVWRERREDERARKRSSVESSLSRHLDLADLIVTNVVGLDRALAIALAAERYSLVPATLGDQGEGFVGGRNPFLIRDAGSVDTVAPVSYSLGRTKALKVAKARNVVVLTGANSGGKTTLLSTLASIHILTLYGLPVPSETAEVVPLPVYLFRRRVTRRIGSLEHALSSLIPVFGDRARKLVLIDEFEALTEPGAAGRIMAAVLNEAASGSSLVLVVTHLARETLPHVRLPIRVDGIEAKGLDPGGELQVDRQPIFGHIGSSMPKLIIMKLSRSTRNRRVKALYDEILSSLKEERVQVQAPIATPWTEEE